MIQNNSLYNFPSQDPLVKLRQEMIKWMTRLEGIF